VSVSLEKVQHLRAVVRPNKWFLWLSELPLANDGAVGLVMACHVLGMAFPLPSC